MNTLVLHDPRCQLHDAGPGHPESARRLDATLRDLEAQAVAGAEVAEPPPATADQLLRVHAPQHLERVAATAHGGLVHLDPDTVAGPATLEAALLAAGAAVAATEAAVDGRSHGAFALVRPPGHHAEPERAMGFCFFNNVAVAAAHAIAEGGLRRVLVLDPDVHHGNGTQSAFWTRQDVLYVSSHRYPFYPGTGAPEEMGEGPGLGTTINLPLPAGAGDSTLVHPYREVVAPIVDCYRPELILVSAGFDTWHRDPLGGMAVTAEGFGALFALFAAWAEAHCPGRLVFVLEGGYDPEGVRVGVLAALRALRGAASTPSPVEEPVSNADRALTRRLRSLFAHRWPVLGG